MKKSFPKSEANRCLVRWAYNMRQGYENIGYQSFDFSDYVSSGGHSLYVDDYSYEEKLCLSEMTAIRVGYPWLYIVAELEYLKQSPWIADCRDNRGWWSDDGFMFYSVAKPARSDFLKMISYKYGMGKSEP
ncbi:MAG: hypothetical protein RQ982_06865 [Gammaproteobacteria bacterium]|nr:hypothetical protein [Gammaproteobacteria bacterium]